MSIADVIAIANTTETDSQENGTSSNHDDHARQQQKQQATYLMLIGLFLALLTAFAAREKRHNDPFEIRPLDLLLLGFATYRGGHLAAYDKVTLPLRKPFTETRPDASGTGKTVVAKGAGPQRALGELLSCPICSGTWIAAGLTYGLIIAPGPTRVFMSILAATGISEWLNAASEALKWSGQIAREQSRA